MKALMLATAMTIAAAPAFAQYTDCVPTPDMLRVLPERYGEEMISERPLSGSPGATEQVWVNPETGTWSGVHAYPGGASCLAAFGTVDPGMEG